MKIRIRYRLLEATEYEELTLTPEEYFEPLDEERAFEWDDEPNRLHTADYLPVPPERVGEIVLSIENASKAMLVQTEVLWNGGRNLFIDRRSEQLALVIVSTNEPSRFDTLRSNREPDGTILLEVLSVIETNEGQVPGPGRVLDLPARELPAGTSAPPTIWCRSSERSEWQATRKLDGVVSYGDAIFSLSSIDELVPQGIGDFNEAHWEVEAPHAGQPLCVHELSPEDNQSRVLEHDAGERRRVLVDIAPVDLGDVRHRIVVDRHGETGTLVHTRSERGEPPVTIVERVW